jgi:hypothetical protein
MNSFFEFKIVVVATIKDSQKVLKKMYGNAFFRAKFLKKIATHPNPRGIKTILLGIITGMIKIGYCL